MTVITQPITEKKLTKQQKEPLVATIKDPEAGRTKQSPLIIALSRSKARRISSLTTACVFFTALLVFATGIIGGIYLYKQFTQYKMRQFRVWCSVPFEDRPEIEAQAERLNQQASGLFENNVNIKPSYFHEEFDIDAEFEQYERIEVPDFSHGRRGRFIHDFSLNKTGLIDLEAGRCFVIPLNRTLVLPPHSLIDMLTKMRSGYYEIDTEVIRESYRVIFPHIKNVKSLGYYIGRECTGLPTYRLEKVQHPVFKRHIDSKEEKAVFSEFAGNKVSELHIINLHSAPGKNTH